MKACFIINKKALSMLVLGGVFWGAQAQSLSGRVVAVESGEGVPYAGVVLQSVADSTSIGRVLCDKQGNFEFADSLLTGLSEGRLVVEALGYDNGEFSTRIPQRNRVLKLANAVGKTLGTAEVTARRYQADKMGYTYNLKGDKKVKGLSALQAMNMVPGLTVDFKGNILLNGVNIKTIYLNGRPLKGVEELKSIPAEYLAKAKVEYIDQTRVENLGSALNLTLDVPKGGYFGHLQSQTRFRKKHYDFPEEIVRGMLYYQRNRWNLYVNAVYSARGGNSGNYYDYIYNDGTSIHSCDRENGWLNYGNAVISMEYNFTPKDKLSLYYGYGGFKYHTNTKNDNSSENLPTYESYAELTRNHDRTNQHAASLLYVHRIDDKGGNFNISADYNGTSQTLDRDISRNDRAENLKLGSEAGTDLYQAAARWNFNAFNWLGGNVSAVYTQYNTSYSPLSLPDANDYYGNFGYPTTTHSSKPQLSVGLSGQIKHWSYFVLARYSYTRTNYKVPLRQIDLKYNQHIVDVLSRVNYDFDDKGKNRLSINYSHWNGALPFEQMDSTRHWSGPYYYSVGNPSLRGSKTEKAGLTFTMFYGKLYFGFDWSHTYDGILDIFEKDPTLQNVVVSKPVNGGKNMHYNVSVGANFQPFKWWHINCGFSYTRSKYWAESKYALQTVYSNFVSGYLNNHFVLPRQWSVDVNFAAESDTKQLNITYKSVYHWDARLAKQLMQERLSLALIVAGGKSRATYEYFDGGYRKWKNRLFMPLIDFHIAWKFNGGRKNIQPNVMKPNLSNDKLPY